MLDKIINFFISLKLTVVCLVYAMVLVFLGTMAQVDEGLYAVQVHYFKSWFVFQPFGLPLIIPGGYLVGGILLINLVMSYVSRYKFTRQHFGLLCVHLGLILLLLGQLGTDFFARESSMRLVEGESKSYSESFSRNEFVLIDTSDPASDQVTVVPDSRLAREKELRLPAGNFWLRVKQYWPNAELFDKAAPDAIPSGATAGLGAQIFVAPKPKVTKMDERDLPAALVEIGNDKGSLGTWLVSVLAQPQSFTEAGKTYKVAMRFAREYFPFSITLLKFRHDVYKGTDIPRNFSSEIRVSNPVTGENRPVLIRMNEPLRYHSYTFYQSSFDRNDPRVSILQVVHNPGWITPYISCVLVGFGLVWQFLLHLLGFMHERKTVAPSPTQTKPATV